MKPLHLDNGLYVTYYYVDKGPYKIKSVVKGSEQF